MSKAAIQKAAIEYLDHGLSVIPCKGKIPALKSWKVHQTARMTGQKFKSLFSRSGQKIGIIMGPISGDLKCIDVDLKYCTDPELFQKLWSKLDDYFEGKNELVLVSTISGGYHILYRSTEERRSGKLAGQLGENGKPVFFLETRMSASYIIAAPSKGYELIRGDYTTSPILTPDQSEDILSICRSFDQIGEKKANHSKEAEQAQKFDSQPNSEANELTPWDHYDQSDDWRRVLRSHGWSVVNSDSEREHWKRPDTENPTSANWHFQKRLFYVFTNNSPFEANKAYSPTGIYTVLECANNRSKACSDLSHAGYGDKPKTRTTAKKATPTNTKGGDQKTAVGDGGNPQILWAVDYLKEQKITYNRVTHKLEVDKKEQSDRDLNTHYLNLKNLGCKITDRLFKTVCQSDFIPAYHPFKDYFNSLTPKKDDSEINKLLKSIQVENEVLKMLVVKWLIQVIFSAYGDGKNELILTLTGAQGSGKTSFFSSLLPDPLSDYYAEAAFEDGKDFKMLLCSYLLVNLDELKGRDIWNSESVKSISSASHFSLRRPYASTIERTQRYAVLCACTNNSGILGDSSGNRRFLPVKLDRRDFQIANSIDKNILWSELLYLYRHHQKKMRVLNKVELDYLNNETTEFRVEDPVQDLILRMFEQGNDEDFLTSSQVMEKINQRTTYKKFSPVAIGRQLKKLGYSRSQKRLNGHPVYGYNIRLIGFETASVDSFNFWNTKN